MTLSSLASILLNIIAPIVLITAVGYYLGRVLTLDSRSLSRLALYLFAPALIFNNAYRSNLGGETATIAAFALIITALMGVVCFALVKVMRYDRMTASAFYLSVLFINAGNYGLPLNLFAFGQEGLTRAVVFFTMSAVLIQTLAVFIAARGSASARAALLNVVKMPLVYAVTLGLALNQSGVVVPEPLMKSIELTGQAAVPVMLVILGIELSRTQVHSDLTALGLATLAKLVLTPMVAFALAALMGLQGLTRAVCILQASMPTAVFSSILAVEFKARPEFVTSVVLVTTVISIVSLTILLGILQ